VVAGRYAVTETKDSTQRIILWTRSRQAAELGQAGQQLAHAAQAYDAAFGPRSKTQIPLWVVECPHHQGCFSNSTRPTSLLSADETSEPPNAEMISSDTVMVDLTAGVPTLAAAAAPSLAASWLGYGQNPAFFEQVPPLSVFPVFAAALGRESVEGPAYRAQVIRHALSRIPRDPEAQATRGKRDEEPPAVLRAKSFLFFYALQDRYGPEVFRKATAAMLSARRGRGFDISDLIASFDQETHENNTAEFVRRWMKHPGVPEEFRARYESDSSTTGARVSEPIPAYRRQACRP